MIGTSTVAVTKSKVLGRYPTHITHQEMSLTEADRPFLLKGILGVFLNKTNQQRGYNMATAKTETYEEVSIVEKQGVDLSLTQEEAQVLNDLLYTAIIGSVDGDRQYLSAIRHALGSVGIERVRYYSDAVDMDRFEDNRPFIR